MHVRPMRMSIPFEIPEWLVAQSDPPPPPVDDHRVEGLVNGFIAGKQDALFDAPDAYGEGNNRTSEQAVLNRMLAKEAFAGSTAQITSELSPTTENGKWRDR
jgi:hypothetical protein